MPITPAPDEVLTIEPPPCSSIAGISYFMHRNALRRSMSSSLDQSSSVVSTSMVGGCSIPALLNAASSRPSSWTVRSTAVLTSPEEVTSHVRATARPPCSATIRAVSSLPAASMSAKATSAPSAAKAVAVARPMPLPAPVTKATLPANLRSVILRSHFLSGKVVELGSAPSHGRLCRCRGVSSGRCQITDLRNRAAVAGTQFDLQLLQGSPLGLRDVTKHEQCRQHVEHKEPAEHGHRAEALGGDREGERDE